MHRKGVLVPLKWQRQDGWRQQNPTDLSIGVLQNPNIHIISVLSVVTLYDGFII
ncbi:hypothetical protein [Methanohalobium sp.]|uniref:hypothetical protein n=1 Tax=Methanohalobium sp. TaxID=2837493 RepID=UPI0025DDED5F|nr:hypothetical protein [Methanohalobium sp.]